VIDFWMISGMIMQARAKAAPDLLRALMGVARRGKLFFCQLSKMNLQ
jgi:hypothetical protein